MVTKIFHWFSVSEHNTSMEPLQKFYLIHKISTEKQANFCENNTLISWMVTANINMEKWTPNMKKFMYFFLF